MNTAIQPLLLSLKPCYADWIFDGLKTVELRRHIASHIENREVFVYVSSPIMALRGGFRIGEVWRDTPEKVWSTVSDQVSIEKQDFNTYFEGRVVAYAFEIREVWKYHKPVNLNDIRNRFSNFVVPQSWRYVRPEEHQFFLEVEPQTREFLEQRRKKPDCRVFNMPLFEIPNFTREERDEVYEQLFSL